MCNALALACSIAALMGAVAAARAESGSGSGAVVTERSQAKASAVSYIGYFAPAADPALALSFADDSEAGLRDVVGSITPPPFRDSAPAIANIGEASLCDLALAGSLASGSEAAGFAGEARLLGGWTQRLLLFNYDLDRLSNRRAPQRLPIALMRLMSILPPLSAQKLAGGA